MPIFDLRDDDLVQFSRQQVPANVYESEIETLLWDNLEELTGQNLFRVRRQAPLPGGLIPDILALDPSGRVVVIEVKRDIDRSQLAQALEYAGWARTTNLDQIASLYHGGEAAFWEDWAEFTGASTPVLVQRDPKLVLVARSFDARTADALDFLIQHRLPVQKIRAAFYVDASRRRVLNVEWETEPEATDAAAPVDEAPDAAVVDDRAFLEVTLADVAATMQTPAQLVWRRPRKGTRYDAELGADGVITLSDGTRHASPSGAAMAAAEVVSYDGWYAWRVGEDGPTLNQLRHRIAAEGGASA